MGEEVYTIKQIKKLYDIEVSSTYSDYASSIIIKIYIDFIPKEITTMTPSEANSYAIFLYNKDSMRTSLEDMTYIRKDEMPILSYTQQEYYLDNYVEEIAEKEYKKLLNTLLSD